MEPGEVGGVLIFEQDVQWGSGSWTADNLLLLNFVSSLLIGQKMMESHLSSDWSIAKPNQTKHSV